MRSCAASRMPSSAIPGWSSPKGPRSSKLKVRLHYPHPDHPSQASVIKSFIRILVAAMVPQKNSNINARLTLPSEQPPQCVDPHFT